MKNQNHIRNVILSVSIIALILAIGSYIYMYRGTFNLVEKTTIARSVMGSSEVTRLQEKEILNLSRKTEESRKRMNDVFVPSQNAVNFIKAIESIGDNSGATVVISSIKSSAPDTTVGSVKIGKVTANVNVTGSWTNVMRSLELFESLPYISEISRISLTSAGGVSTKDVEQKWQLAFDISVSSI